MKQRFLIIAWPEGHEKNLTRLAHAIQEELDIAQVGGARVIAATSEALETHIAEELGDLCP